MRKDFKIEDTDMFKLDVLKEETNPEINVPNEELYDRFGFILENEFKCEKIFATDGLMIEAGADPRIEIPKQLNIKLDSQTNEIIVDKDQRTNIEGIYAAGDITNSSNLKQTITAASQGAIAALSSYIFLMETS